MSEGYPIDESYENSDEEVIIDCPADDAPYTDDIVCLDLVN